MSEPPRYSDDEARRILARAAELSVPDARALAGTVAIGELVRIGEEAGLSRETVARAALEVTYGADRAAARHTIARVPYAVTRTAVGDAPVTDATWAEIVRTCRATFEAAGEVLDTPGLRVWQNGNLRVQLEAVPGGSRLSLSTRKADAGWAAITGGSWAAAFASLAAGVAASGAPVGKVVALAVLAVPGLAGIAWEYARMSRWAQIRQAQFDALASRLPSLLRRPDTDHR